jgi:hypothetical protein
MDTKKTMKNGEVPLRLFLMKFVTG